MSKDNEGSYFWKLEDHVCRACFGRVVSRVAFDKRTLFRCTNCGIEIAGKDSRVLCCCGLKLRTKIDAGLRCTVNASRTAEFPSEIVAEQAMPPDSVMG